jgi:hypothetical protein
VLKSAPAGKIRDKAEKAIKAGVPLSLVSRILRGDSTAKSEVKEKTVGILVEIVGATSDIIFFTLRMLYEAKDGRLC